MKIAKYLLFVALATVLMTSCRETTPDPNVPFETAVHGYGELQKPDTFAVSNVAAPVNFRWRWVSIDKANTVNKVEFYVYFDESYKDKDGNPKTARHGGVAGDDFIKLWKTVATPAANFAYTNFTITQSEIYNLYKTNKFDYGDGKGSQDVFAVNGRSEANPFKKTDKFTIRWVLYTADGRRFDSWTTNVCGDFVGANCVLQIPVK